MRKNIERKEIEEFIKKHLTMPKYPELVTKEWDSFCKKNFTRSGKSNDEEYSAKVNENLSRAATCETIEYIAKLLKKEFLEG